MVILITGKAGAGKTHYGVALYKELKEEGIKAVHLDGDVFRSVKQNQDFSDEGRIKNLTEAAEVAAALEKQGNVVIMSFIAPKLEWRNMMRLHWNASKVIYIPGGTLWEGSEYEKPDELELVRTI